MESTPCVTVPSLCDTSGKIPIKVSLSAGETAPCVAIKVGSQLDTQTDFCADECLICACMITVTTSKNGNATDTTDGTCGTGFTFATPCQGIGELANTASSPATIIVACCDVCVACDSYNEPCHGFCTGVRGQWTTSAGDLPCGLFVDTESTHPSN